MIVNVFCDVCCRKFDQKEIPDSYVKQIVGICIPHKDICADCQTSIEDQNKKQREVNKNGKHRMERFA